MKKLHTLVLLLACTLAVGCSSGGDDPIDDPKPTTTPTPTPTPTPSDPTDADLANYKCPTYVDNYVSIADWSKRSQWNLANVHDPSVMKAADGYYYMYQTDASYGNAHEGHGHFHARRSKDLVNWEYLGGTMTVVPAWVKTKLNEIRAEQGLAPITNPSYGYWAPCGRKVKDHPYRMSYAIVVNNTIKT